MKKYWRLYKMFFKINFMKDMAYRGNFLVGLILTTFESVTVFVLVKIIFSYIKNIAGWSYYDVLVLSGIFMCTQAFGWVFYKGGLGDLDRIINRGEMDWFLVKPIDPQFISTIHRIDLEDGARSFIGLAVIILGLSGSNIFSVLIHLPLFFVTFICGQIIIYSIYLIVKTVSFKSIEGWATDGIAVNFHELAQYPTDIYKGIMKVVYLYLIPLVFVATVPAKALTGKLNWQLFVGSLLAAFLSFIISRFIWKIGLSKYSTASS